jgi:hypothetical protein
MRQRQNEHWLYCWRTENSPLEPGNGRGMVCWIERGTDALSSIRIANAFRDVADGDFAAAIVEAFSAFEIALFTLVSGHLDKHCTSKALRESLERRLNVPIMMAEVLPEMCQQFGIKRLDNAVTEALHRLRKCRNHLLHRGSSETITASMVGEYLAAALIGVAFVRHVEALTQRLAENVRKT